MHRADRSKNLIKWQDREGITMIRMILRMMLRMVRAVIKQVIRTIKDDISHLTFWDCLGDLLTLVDIVRYWIDNI